MILRVVFFVGFPLFLFAQEKFSVEPFFNRQLSSYERDSLNKRISYLHTMLEKDSLNMSAYFERGCTYFLLGMHHKAYYDFSRIIQYDSTNATAYYNRALCRAKYSYNYDACTDLYKAKTLGLKEAEWLYSQKCKLYKTKIENDMQ